MAKSISVIRMEFEKAKQQADKLEQISKQVRQIADERFASCMSEIGRAWISDSSKAYQKKGRILQEQLRKRADDLQKTASTIRTIASNTYQAEIRAYQLAQVRKY